MQSRTHWHDLLGRHCPRFGQDTTVDAQISASMQRESPCKVHKIQVTAQSQRDASLLSMYLCNAGGNSNPTARGICQCGQIQDTIYIRWCARLLASVTKAVGPLFALHMLSAQ